MAPLITTDMSIGERIAAYRMYRGMTQEACAGLVGKSLSWWRKIEQGIRHVEKLSDLVLICRVLRVPELADLTGVLECSLAMDQQRERPMLPELRRTLIAGPAMDRVDPPELTTLRGELDDARRTFHTHRMFVSQCGGLLPSLIKGHTAAYRASSEPGMRRPFAGMLSEVYILACQILRDAGDFPLAYTAADRATLYAQHADDPVQIAWAAWEASGALKDLGNPEEGLMHCQDALEVLTPLIGQSP